MEPSKKQKLDDDYDVDCDIVPKFEHACPRDRVTFSVYVDPKLGRFLDPKEPIPIKLMNASGHRIVDAQCGPQIVSTTCIKRMIRTMMTRRGIESADGLKLKLTCSVLTWIANNACSEHAYYVYEIVVKPLAVRTLMDICTSVCLEYFLLEFNGKIGYRYEEYANCIPARVKFVLNHAWEKARNRGMIVKISKPRAPIVNEARFAYQNPKEPSSYRSGPHPTEKIVISSRDLSSCEFIHLSSLLRLVLRFQSIILTLLLSVFQVRIALSTTA